MLFGICSNNIIIMLLGIILLASIKHVQETKFTCKITSLHVRVKFVPPALFYQLDTISCEEGFYGDLL